jgi:serine/threonine protein kinase
MVAWPPPCEAILASVMEHIEPFGKYNLHERVAIGGMAEIFRATIKGIGGFERTVAIKRMHRHLGEDEDLAKTLIDEARLAVQLNHANIGQVFDLGRIDQQYFMVMEFIEGSDFHGILRRLRDQNRLISPAIACHAVAEMLEHRASRRLTTELDAQYAGRDQAGGLWHRQGEDAAAGDAGGHHQGQVLLYEP